MLLREGKEGYTRSCMSPVACSDFAPAAVLQLPLLLASAALAATKLAPLRVLKQLPELLLELLQKIPQSRRQSCC